MIRLKLPVIADASTYESHFNDGVWQQAAAAICARHHLPYARLRRSQEGENIISNYFSQHDRCGNHVRSR